MNNYQGVKLQLQQLIDSLEDRNFNNLKSVLLDKTTNVYVKEWKDNDLVMITNNFVKKNTNISDLEKECRSLILDKETLQIVCYSYDDIYYNQDAKDFLIKNNGFQKKIQECFEGTMLSVFFHNGSWNVATRRCIDARKSTWNSTKTHFDLFMECINVDFDEFTQYLNKENNYFFVLVHHQNKHIVDYTDYFNDPEYKKILHVLTRRKEDHCEVSSDEEWSKTPNFIKPKDIPEDQDTLQLGVIAEMEDFSKLDNLNTKNKLDLPVKSEGLIVKLIDPATNKTVLLKFQTNSYQFMGILKPNTNNIYMSFIELYQNDMLKRHLEYFPGNSKFESNDNEIYDTVGIIDATFKVLTSELFELFRALYNLKDCSHKNEELYTILPTEFTIALYRIRGIYYKKKEKYIKSKQAENDSDSQGGTQVNTGLRIFDIYNMLKYTYDTKDLLKLLRARKVLFYKCSNENENTNYKKILNLSHRCDKVSIKMMTIMLNNMFPKDKNIELTDNSVDENAENI